MSTPVSRSIRKLRGVSIGFARGISIILQANRHYLWPLGFFAVYVLLIRNLTVGHLYAFGDYPPLYGPSAIEFFTTTWQWRMLGFYQPASTAAAYLGVLTTVGGVLAQNIFYLVLIPASFLSFRYFLFRFTTTEPARTLGAAVYAINPVTIGQFANGGGNELISLVGMPLVLHFLWEVVEDNSWDASLKAGAVFGATTIIPWTSFWLIAPFAGYLGYRSLRAPRTTGKLVVAGALGVGLTLPNLFYLLLRARSLTSTTDLFNAIEFTYSDVTPLLLARLAGNRGSYAMEILGYNEESALLIGLVIPLVALIGIRRRETWVFLATAVGIASFMLGTKHGLTYPLFELFPPLFSLRNPNKLYYSLLICAGGLFGMGLDSVLVRVQGRDTALVRSMLLGIIVLSLVSYAAPAAGGLGLTEMRGDNYYIPPEYDDVAAELDGRVLWLPYSYTTQLRLRHVYPDHVGVRSGGLINGRENAEYVQSLFKDFAAGDSIHSRLQTLGVKYVVVDGLAQTRVSSHAGGMRLSRMNYAPWLFGDPGIIEARLEMSDAYELAFRTENFAVFRVIDSSSREGFIRERGLHRIYYPTATTVDILGENRVVNSDFEDGLTGWWTWSGEDGTQTDVVTTSESSVAVLSTRSGSFYPIAQEIGVTPGTPYRIDVRANGSGSVNLYWYDGKKSPEALVSHERISLLSLPQTVRAKGDLLSIRVRPDESRLAVQNVSVHRTTYPPKTGYQQNIGGIPGVVVDGRETTVTVGKVVAVNLPDSAASNVDADVRIVDAETELDGELVYDDRYRQGVGVLVANNNVSQKVPATASTVSYDTTNGTVLDYWVEGSLDTTPVTLLYTSYHEDWRGPPDSVHFKAYGWANGFVGANPEEVRWTGNTDIRTTVIDLWLALWGVTIVSLALVKLPLQPPFRRRRRVHRTGVGMRSKKPRLQRMWLWLTRWARGLLNK